MAWRLIKSAPCDGTLVDLWADGVGRIPNAQWRDEDWVTVARWQRDNKTKKFIPFYTGWSGYEPSHWMPIPKGPRP